jgi:DNA polymerase-1
MVRECYVPRKGWVILEVDYSGIEVKIAACYHKDPTMMKYLTDPTTDMHRDCAAALYMLPQKSVSKMTRYAAKNMFVFPEFYGSIYYNCASNLWKAIDRLKLTVEVDEKEISLKEWLRRKGIKELGECDPKKPAVKNTFEFHVQEVERDFWNNRFPIYSQWKRRFFNEYQANLGFGMKTGFWVGGYHKRADVINYPVQGAAFHCLLWSLIQMNKWLKRHRMKTKIIGEIHDSMILDGPESEIQDVLTQLHKIMTVDVVKHWPWIIVPLETEVDVTPVDGPWSTKKPWICKNDVWRSKC